MMYVGSNSCSNRRDVLMEGIGGVELEEGEACSYHDDDDDVHVGDPTFDPDVALSYIGEKLQNVLGHLQKDFEGLVSAESLGPKNGEYGTFLPSYRRSPVCSHPKSPPRVQNRHTPQPPSTSAAEGRNRNSIATADVSHSVKHGSTSAHPASSTACESLAQNQRCVQIPKVRSIQEKSAPKSENRDHRTLKLRIKVGGSEKLSKPNTAIYNGLGLEGSPSSSFDDSLKESQQLSRRQACGSSESPTQILQMMTSFPVYGGCVLSPLMDDLLQLSEKPKYPPDISVRPSSKVNERHFYRVKDNKALYGENTMASDDKEGLCLQNKGETNDDVDVVSCEELISNALKLPLLSDSYGNEKGDVYSNIVKCSTKKPNGMVKGEVIDTNETVAHLDNVIKFMDLGKQVANQSFNCGDDMGNGKYKPSSAGKKKTKKDRVHRSSAVKVVESTDEGAQALRDKKNFHTKGSTLKSEPEILSTEKDMKKMNDKYSDFFGNLSDHEDEAINSPAVSSREKLKASEVVETARLGYDNISREKTRPVQSRAEITSEMKNSSKSRRKSISGTPSSGPSVNAFVQENNHPISDQAFVGADSDVWVQCDACKEWRLLPPGSKADQLPDKWHCSLQTWLPDMNRCGISQEECVKVVLARYNLLPEIQTSPDGPLGKLATGTSTSALDISNPIVSNGGKQKKTSNSSFGDYSNGPSSSLKKKQQSAKVKASAKSKDDQLTNAQQTKSSDMALETNKLRTLKQLQADCHSDGGNSKSLKIKARRLPEQESPRTSKRSKTIPLVQGNEMFDVSSENVGVADTAGKDQMTNSEFVSLGKFKDETSGKRTKHELNSGNIAPNKRKGDSLKDLPNDTPSSSKGADQNEQSRSKRSRMSKSEGKEASPSKRNGKTDRRRSTSQQTTDHNEPLKKNSSSANVAATSSSSKATVSLKVKYKFQETKSSPVESVSSSPLRGPISDKLASGFNGIMEKVAIGGRANHKSVQEKTSEERYGDGGADGLVPDNQHDRNFGKNDVKMSESYVEMPGNMEVHEEREQDRKNRFQDNFGSNVGKCEQDTMGKQEPSIPECREQENDEKDAPRNFDVQKPEPSKSMSIKEKSQCLPPVDGKKNEASKEPQVNTKTDSQNGINHGLSKPSIPNGHRVRNKEAPSPHRRDSVSQAASTAIKEAKSLKHLADRLKNADSMESTGLYFDAALKFLHGASLLESGKTESAKYGDIVQAMQIYSDTAKLCRFCAHEYEKSKDMATAALAYKCMEVAYLRVVYSSHNVASRDRSELQTVLQMVPPGESPSSSASDIDNLNNNVTGEKAAQARNVDSPLLAGNLVIAARNRPNFSRLLSFAQDVNSAMEASRKSHIAFEAASDSMGHKDKMDGITSIKRALDFNFHDVEGLLRLVRLAKEATSR